MNTLKLVTPASLLPVTLEEVKEHLRVDDDDEDDLIGIYLDAAIAHAESFMGRALVDQTWDYYLDSFPDCGGWIELPRQPVLEVSAFDNGESPGFDDYQVDLAGGRLYLPQTASWPVTVNDVNVVRVRFRAGYVDTSESPHVGEVPKDIINAIFLMVGTLYGIRETIIVGQSPVSVPWSAEQLLRRHRIETSLA